MAGNGINAPWGKTKEGVVMEGFVQDIEGICKVLSNFNPMLGFLILEASFYS